MPQSIKDHILNKCKNETVKVTLIEEGTNKLLGNLEFDSEGFSKTTEEKVNIVGYIERLIKHSKRVIIIKLNDVPLDEVGPALLTNDAGRQVPV